MRWNKTIILIISINNRPTQRKHTIRTWKRWRRNVEEAQTWWGKPGSFLKCWPLLTCSPSCSRRVMLDANWTCCMPMQRKTALLSVVKRKFKKELARYNMLISYCKPKVCQNYIAKNQIKAVLDECSYKTLLSKQNKNRTFVG